MVVYIPNVIYNECKKGGESMEEFIKEVFEEWCDEFIITYGIVGGNIRKSIENISVIEEKIGT